MDYEIQSGLIIGDTPANANPKANLQTVSTDKGWLPNRMTTAQRTAIAGLGIGDKGLFVFDTTTNTYWYWNGSIWVDMGASGGNTNWKGALASSPVSGVAGDWYTNTTTGEDVYYDATRSKWLSFNSYTLSFARSGDIGNNTPLQVGVVVMSTTGTPRGFLAGFDATIIGFYCNRSNTDFVATLDVYKNNVIASPILQENFSPATDLDISNSAINVDIAATDVLGVRVTGGVTAKVSFPIGQIVVKRKY